MALSTAEADYVASLQAQRLRVASQLKNAAEQLVRARNAINIMVSDNQTAHDSAYGVDSGADADFDTEQASVDTGIDALFTTGLIAETRQEMETRLAGNNAPPG